MELALIRNSATASSSDFQIFADRTDSLSVRGMSLIAINMCVRSAFHLTGTYITGAIGAIISLFVAAVTSYSLQLLVHVAASTRRPLLEGMWSDTYGKRLAVIWPIVSVIIAICRVGNMTSDIVEGINWIISRFVDDPPSWLTDPMAIGLLAWVVVMIPLSLLRSLKSAVTISTFCLFLIIIMAVHQIYFFTSLVVTEGFDPDNRFTFCKWGPRVLVSFSNAFTAYELAPITWPGLRHMRNSTPRRLGHAFLIATMFGFFARVLMGLIPYLTFFDDVSALIMQEKYPERVDVVLQLLVKVVIELFSICLALNSGRYSFCNVVREYDTIPLEVWTATGASICLIGVMLVGHGETMDTIVTAVNGVGTVSLQFIIPPILFIKIFGARRLLNSIGAVGSILVGLFGIASILYAALE